MNQPKFPKECASLVCKYLTKECFFNLKDKQTSNGFTLEKAICSGVENPDSQIGIYAGDDESYELFAPLFDPIIKDYHNTTLEHEHKSDLSLNNLNLPSFEVAQKYILSTRIRVGRNLKGFPLGAAISREERNEVEKIVVQSLKALKGELEGEYYPLYSMSKEVEEQLIKEHFLFRGGDRFLESAGLNRDWPEARGIFHNHEKSFLVWLNEEDQLRIISMQKGGDIQAVFARLVKALAHLEKQMEFLFSNRLGYISSCPTNLGTAMRASVHIRLPLLSKNMEKFEEITNQYHLQIRGVDGEHTQTKGEIFDISNLRRLGITEVEAIEEMVRGVLALVEAEEALSSEF